MQTELNPTSNYGGRWPGRTVRTWDVQCTAEPWPLAGVSISPCTTYRGSVLLFTRLSLILVTTSLFWPFCYLAFSLRLLVCSSAPPCPNSLLSLPCITRSGERLQPAERDLLSETYYTTDTYFPWDISYPHSPDFLTDKGSLSHHHEQGAACCSGKQKWEITGANSFLWVQEQYKRQEHASVFQSAQGGTPSILKNHIYNYVTSSYSSLCIIFSLYTHIFLCVVTAEMIVFALKMPQRKATNIVYSYSVLISSGRM